MIEVIHMWKCTHCDHSKRYDPLMSHPPVKCPACNNGYLPGTDFSYKRTKEVYK